MKRLFLLALFGAAAWYGWHHWGAMLAGNQDSEAILVNDGTHAMLRVRLTVGGQTFVRDAIEPEASATLPFHIANSSDFRLRWEWRGLEGTHDWSGGEVETGTTRMRCTLQVYDDATVVSACSPIPGKPAKP